VRQGEEDTSVSDDSAYIESVKERTEELDKVLSEFGDRLRRMRERNKRTQQEIESFQRELDDLHDWLVDHL
jgi:prefoldin subunit 5